MNDISKATEWIERYREAFPPIPDIESPTIRGIIYATINNVHHALDGGHLKVEQQGELYG